MTVFQLTVGPESIVLLPPPFDDHLGLFKSIENLPVEHLISWFSIEVLVVHPFAPLTQTYGVPAEIDVLFARQLNFEKFLQAVVLFLLLDSLI